MKRIGGDVNRELRRFGTAGEMADLVGIWAETVGVEIARNAWPARFGRDGTLHVATSSSAWAFELGQLAADVLTRLRGKLGENAPRRLKFAVGVLPEAVESPSSGPPNPPTAPGETEHARAAELTAPIGSEELRAAVAEAAAHSLARGSADRSV